MSFVTTAERAVEEDSCFNNPVVFTDYAKFHEQNLMRDEGNFLIYTCHGSCGGYGNRIEGITMALLFAILSNRIFLIDMTHPFDINRLLHPNVIKWNYTGYMDINMDINMTTRDVYLMDEETLINWPSLSGEFFNPNINIVTFYTNLGFPYYFKVFDDKWIQMLRDQFSITKDNNIMTYGCVSQYLFTYDKNVTDAIQKEMQQLGLIPGQYVSIHFRSFLEMPDHVHPSPGRFLRSGVKIARKMFKKLNKHFKVYLVTDSHEAKERAIIRYPGQVVPSNVTIVHVDRDIESLYEGFIGVIVNIEVAARGTALVRSYSSTFADLIESIGQFSKESVTIFNY